MKKWLILIIILIPLLYAANYIRLANLPPRPIDYVAAIDYNTQHSHTQDKFIPENQNIDGLPIRISHEIPYMGTHYFLLNRIFAGDDLPKGYMEYKGEVVGVFYSDHEYPFYSRHLHKNLCLTEGLAPTTEFSYWQCFIKGYWFWPWNDYMLHYWFNYPNDPNSEWNGYLI